MTPIDAKEIRSRIRFAQLFSSGMQLDSLLEAVSSADLLNDVDLGFEARVCLLDAASQRNRADVELVTLSWCLGKMDEYPHRFNRFQLLWKYKWVIGSASGLLEISREQLYGFCDDMERRFADAGYSMHAPCQLRRWVMVAIGDLDAATAAHRRFLSLPRDTVSDCEICVANADCRYHLAVGDRAKALAIATDMIERGLRCSYEPQVLQSEMLLTLLEAGRREEAVRWMRDSHRPVYKEPFRIRPHARHIEFATAVGFLSRAGRFLCRRLHLACTCQVPGDQIEVFLAARVALREIERRGTKTLPMTGHHRIPVPNDEGRVETVALLAWIDQQSRELAAKFDARNGNDLFMQRIANDDASAN